MSVIFNEAGMRFFFKDEMGPTGIWLGEKTRDVAYTARINASGRPGPRVRTGDLVQSIQGAVFPDGRYGIAGVVWADASHGGRQYAIDQELGGIARFRMRRGPQAGEIAERRYRYPFLEPALRFEFGMGGRRGGS